MRSLLTLFLCSTLFALVLSEAIEWDYRTFPSKTNEGLSLVSFYAPWCGHCKKLAPIWDQLADKLSDVAVGKFDCTEAPHKFMCNRYGVNSYPKIFLLQGRNYVVYQGERSLEALEKFVNTDHTGVWKDTIEIKSADAVGKTYAQVPSYDNSVLTRVEPENLRAAVKDGNYAILLEQGSAFDKDFQPLVEYAVREAQAAGSPIKGVIVNVLGSDLPERYNLESFPSLLVTQDGNGYLYTEDKHDWKPVLQFLSQFDKVQSKAAANWREGHKLSLIPGYELPPPFEADCIHTFTLEACVQKAPIWVVIFIFVFGLIFGAMLRRQHIVKPKGN